MPSQPLMARLVGALAQRWGRILEPRLMRVQLVMTLPREAASVPMARHTLTAALRSAGVTPDCVDEVEVALSEACTNAIQHVEDTGGYEVVINLADQQVTIDVLDTGHGFGDPPASPAMADGSAEQGRGMALMQALTDRAVFDSVTAGGGSVHLMKTLRWTDNLDTTLASGAAGGAEDGAPAPPAGA